MSGIHLNNNPFGKSGIVSKKDEHFVKNLHSKEKEEMHHAKSGSSFPPEKQESKGRCVTKKKETRELLVETQKMAILETKNILTIKSKTGNLPNFEKLTALLNQQKRPRRMLRVIVSLSKPLLDGGDHRLQKP